MANTQTKLLCGSKKGSGDLKSWLQGVLVHIWAQFTLWLTSALFNYIFNYSEFGKTKENQILMSIVGSAFGLLVSLQFEPNKHGVIMFY